MDLIGRMFLMSITESISVPTAEFEAEWVEHGLSKKHLPRRRTASEAFRKATPKRQWKNGFMLLEYAGGQHLDDDTSNEVMMVFSQDSKSKVDIHHLNRAILYLKDEKVEVEILDILSDEEISFIEKIKQDFDRALKNIDGSQCRNTIQKVMEECACLTYRDGSYLIPRQYFETADAIVGMFHFMNAHSERPNVLWDIPYIDTPATRAQTQQAIVEHIQRVSSSVIEEVKNLTPSTRNVARSRRSTLTARLSDVGLTIATYERILGMRMNDERAMLASALRELSRI